MPEFVSLMSMQITQASNNPVPGPSQVFERGGGNENRIYQRPFTSAARVRKNSGSPGALPYSRKKLNLGLAEMQLFALLVGLLAPISLFLDDILSHS